MAVTAIKVLSRFTVPGGGRSLTGVAKNNKQIVSGEITGGYLSDEGLDLEAFGGGHLASLGLDKIDFICFDVKTINAVASANAAVASATFNHNLGRIFPALDGDTKPSDAQVCVVKFMAIGDGAEVVGL
ncbi:MAG: hypothetical protein JRC86_12735 [Deltaproteobacteria bacterium]|nr:hypothetical protein [Deltaproteobacteria bacterium]